MQKYLEQFAQVIDLLLSFGPKLQPIVASVELILTEAQKILDLLSSGVGAGPLELTPELQANKAKLLAAYSADGVSGILDRVLAFLETHPQLLTLVITLLTTMK